MWWPGSCDPSDDGRVWEPVVAGAREPAPVETPPSAQGGRGWHVGREAAMVSPPLMCHLTIVLCFYGSLNFLHKHSQLHVSSISFPQPVSSQPTAVLSLGLLSEPHIPAPSPRPH